MKLQNLSVRAFLRKIAAGTMFTAAILVLIFYLLTKDVRIVICGCLLTGAFYIWGIVFLHYFQKKLSLFTDGLCRTLDDMMDRTERPQIDYEAETLLSRISHRLERLYHVMQKTRHKVELEKEDLQSLISDISHQTKTPIANLKMLNDTMLTRPLTEEKQKEFLQATGAQLDKLDFLIQGMVKTSRL
ncbi:MAG: histidine kinase dimerization/phospho-acceptor domain-containing protein, partial [Lachnospiraceae bacterium]